MAEPVRILKVHLCSNPDQVCLQGGCGYCGQIVGDRRWRSVSWLRGYAEARGWVEDFNYGHQFGWPNQDKRWSDGSTHR